jgi:hypothetical protein
VFVDEFHDERILLLNILLCIEVAEAGEIIPERQQHEVHALNLENGSVALTLSRVHDEVPCRDNLFLPKSEQEFDPVHLCRLVAPFISHIYSVFRRPRLQPVALGSFTLAGRWAAFSAKAVASFLREPPEKPERPEHGAEPTKNRHVESWLCKQSTALLCKT